MSSPPVVDTGARPQRRRETRAALRRALACGLTVPLVFTSWGLFPLEARDVRREWTESRREQQPWPHPADPPVLPTAERAEYSADWVLHFLSPVTGEREGFDASLLEFVEVRICPADEPGDCEGVVPLTAANGDIQLKNGVYQVDWGPLHSFVGVPLQIRFSVAGLPVGSIHYVPDSPGAGPMRFRIDKHPRIRGRVLHRQGSEALELARVLVDEFALGSLHTTRVLAGEGYAPEDLGRVLMDVYRERAEDAAWLLRANGQTAPDVSAVLRDVYLESARSVGGILRAIGYSCIEIAEASREFSGKDPRVALEFLAAADCAPDANCFLPEDDEGEEIVVRTQLVDSLSTVLDLLPPVGDRPDPFDRSLLQSLRLEVIEVDSDGSRTVRDELSAGGNRPDDIRLLNGFYEVHWSAPFSSVGSRFELRFTVAGLHLALLEYAAATPRTLPIRFRIDNHPVLRARMLLEAGIPSDEVVRALLREFGTEAHEIARILYEERIDAVELGEALRDGLPPTSCGSRGAADCVVTPETVADALYRALIPATTAIRSLEGAFDLSHAEAVGVLQVVGYRAVEVWNALDTVFHLSDHEIEHLLRSNGYSEAEVLAALAPRLLSKYACLIDQSGPRVYFHPDETYMPSSVEWFMTKSPLVWGVNDVEYGRLQPGEVTPETLAETAGEIQNQNPIDLDFWFDASDPTTRAGNLASARMYVHAVRLRDLRVTDLQFWLYYPYNGPGSMAASSDLFGLGNVCLDTSNKGNVAPLGEHESDWEVIVMRFDDETNDLLEVYLSAHGDYMRWENPDNPAPLTKDRFRLENGHVVAHSALNGHAYFAHEGENKGREAYVDFGIGDFEFKTLNWAGYGRSFDAWTSYEFIALDGTFLDTSWLEFEGKWGAFEDFNLSYSEKVEIIYSVADDCLLAIHLIHIPAACTGLCVVSCIPALLGYGACVASCIPSCIVISSAALHVAIPIVGPRVLDANYEDVGTGKPGPAVRGEEWRHFRIPNEKPRVIAVTDLGVPGAATRHVIVGIPDQVCERKDPKFLRAGAVCVDTPSMERVDLGIDGQYHDITGNPVPGTSGSFWYDWDVSASSGPSVTLNPRYSDAEGIEFEYTEGEVVQVGASGPGLALSLVAAAIRESETAILQGTFSAPGEPKEVTIDWGDGHREVLPSVVDGFSASHTYADDGAYLIAVTVDGEPGVASRQVTVGNEPPRIDAVSRHPVFPSIEQAPVTVDTSVSFSDPGSLDSHEVAWDWADGPPDIEPDAGSPATGSHLYGSPGVFGPSVVVRDDDGGVARAALRPVVVSPTPGTAGAGTVEVPVADPDYGLADFSFDVSTDAQSDPVVSFTLGVRNSSFRLQGVNTPSVTFDNGTVEVEGGVAVNGKQETPDGEPYLVRMIAGDGSNGDPDTFHVRVWYEEWSGGGPIERVIYETEARQALGGGSVTVSAPTASGSGWVDAPDPEAFELREAPFGFVLYTNGQGVQVFDLELAIEGVRFEGLDQPSVTTSGNRIEVEGGTLLNGEEETPEGETYRIRILAVDGGSTGADTFQFRAWSVDENGTEDELFATGDLPLLSGDIVVVEPPPPAPYSPVRPSDRNPRKPLWR